MYILSGLIYLICRGKFGIRGLSYPQNVMSLNAKEGMSLTKFAHEVSLTSSNPAQSGFHTELAYSSCDFYNETKASSDKYIKFLLMIPSNCISCVYLLLTV